MNYNLDWRLSSNFKININSFVIRTFKNLFVYKVNEGFENTYKRTNYDILIDNYLISIHEYKMENNNFIEIKNYNEKSEIYTIIYDKMAKNYFRSDGDFLVLENNLLNIFDSFNYKNNRILPFFSFFTSYINCSLKLIYKFEFYFENKKKDDVINYYINNMLTTDYNTNKKYYILLDYIQYNSYENKNELDILYENFYKKHSYLNNRKPVKDTLFIRIKCLNNNKIKIGIKKYFIELWSTTWMNNEFHNYAYYLSYRYSYLLNKLNIFRNFGFQISDKSENLIFISYPIQSKITVYKKKFERKFEWAIVLEKNDLEVGKIFINNLLKNNFKDSFSLDEPKCFLIDKIDSGNSWEKWCEGLDSQLDPKFKFVFLIFTNENHENNLTNYYAKYLETNFIVINYLKKNYNLDNHLLFKLKHNFTYEYYFDRLRDNYNISIIFKGDSCYFILNIILFNKIITFNFYNLDEKNLKIYLSKQNIENIATILITDFNIDIDLNHNFLHFQIRKENLNKLINLKDNSVYISTLDIQSFQILNNNISYGNNNLFYENFFYNNININNSNDYLFSMENFIYIWKLMKSNNLSINNGFISNSEKIDDLWVFIFFQNYQKIIGLYDFQNQYKKMKFNENYYNTINNRRVFIFQ